MTLLQLHRILSVLSIIFNIVTTIISKKLVENIKNDFREFREYISELK